MIKTTITDYLDQTAAKFPSKIAFQDLKEKFTFCELVDASKRIGTCIAKCIGVQTPVAVYMEKGANNLAAFFGAVYAGCFYTPIDSNMPTERVQHIIDCLQPGIIIYDASTKDKLNEIRSNALAVSFNEANLCLQEKDILASIHSAAKQTDILYVLFTSGSTGIPKGVTISHLAAIDFMEWICDKYSLDESTSLCNQAPFYFDASMPDIYIPLKTGATVFIPPKSYFTFPKKVMEYIKENEINTLIWVPSALCNVINCNAFNVCTPMCVKLVVFCGEVMPCKHLNIWRKHMPGATFVNMYGPTEATYACTYYNIKKEFSDTDVLPLGRACENSKVLLFNENDELASVGEIGEICILGQCLSNGYYNLPEKSSEVFVQNPINHSWREYIYRTGDLAVKDERGELFFVGRKDFQIKRLGHRIELGEIENAILSAEGTHAACCIFLNEEEQIVAFFSGEADEITVRNSLLNRIPNYMMPNIIIKIPYMPLNINGKIDRIRLKREYKEYGKTI